MNQWIQTIEADEHIIVPCLTLCVIPKGCKTEPARMQACMRSFGINWLKLFNDLIILCFVTVCCFWCVFDRNCRRLLYLMSKACYLFVCDLYLSVLPVCKVFCQNVYLLCVFVFPPSSYHPDPSIDLVVSVSQFFNVVFPANYMFGPNVVSVWHILCLQFSLGLAGYSVIPYGQIYRSADLLETSFLESNQTFNC